jgi:hypothetical protein
VISSIIDSDPKFYLAAVGQGERQPYGWVELKREGGPRLTGPEAAVYAYGAGLVSFARKNRFDSAIGKRLKPFHGGHARCSLPPPPSRTHTPIPTPVHPPTHAYLHVNEMSLLS